MQTTHGDVKPTVRYYVHTDALGSIGTITDGDARITIQRSYEPYGEIRSLSQGAPVNQTKLTNRSFTGHEQIDEVDGFIHMGGRVYDSTIGRFVSADIHVLHPYSTQSYNRYSYVRNNPLGFVDPSGYAGIVVNAQQAREHAVRQIMAQPEQLRSEGDYTPSPHKIYDIALRLAEIKNPHLFTNKAQNQQHMIDVDNGFFKEGVGELIGSMAWDVPAAYFFDGYNRFTNRQMTSKEIREARVLGLVGIMPFMRLIKPKTTKTLYHYTSDEGLGGILNTKKLNSSLKANNPKDARYGDGQYLSDIILGTRKNSELSYDFIGIPFQGKKFKNYIEIDISGLNPKSPPNYTYEITSTSKAS